MTIEWVSTNVFLVRQQRLHGERVTPTTTRKAVPSAHRLALVRSSFLCKCLRFKGR